MRERATGVVEQACIMGTSEAALKEKGQRMDKKITLDELQWEGNSKIMFDEIMDDLGPMYRAAVNKKFEVWVNQKQQTVIREWNIKHTLEKYAPPNYCEKYMKIYEKYKSEEAEA